MIHSELPTLLPRLWAYALRISGDRYDAEDLLQRSCIRALEREHQWRPDSSALSWIFSIIHSTWMNELRARRTRNCGKARWEDDCVEMIVDPNAATPEDEAILSEIVNAVQRLPETQRVVMQLVGAEGLSYAEAALALEIPIGTVMSRLSRARLAIAGAGLLGQRG